MAAAQGPQALQAVTLAESIVEENHARRRDGRLAETVFGGGDGGNRVAFMFQVRRDRIPRAFAVVDDQYSVAPESARRLRLDRVLRGPAGFVGRDRQEGTDDAASVFKRRWRSRTSSFRDCRPVPATA